MILQRIEFNTGIMDLEKEAFEIPLLGYKDHEEIRKINKDKITKNVN